MMYVRGWFTGGGDAVELVIEMLFALVFLRALASYVAHRDPVQRDLMLVFSAMAVLTALWVVRLFVPHPPRPITVGPSMLLLAQPYLTLRLVAQLRRVPRWLRTTALVVWVVSCVPILVFPVTPQWAVIPIIGPYVLIEVIAAGYFVAEAGGAPVRPARGSCAPWRERSCSPRRSASPARPARTPPRPGPCAPGRWASRSSPPSATCWRSCRPGGCAACGPRRPRSPWGASCSTRPRPSCPRRPGHGTPAWWPG